jgi:LDH2 family malate/lactate/ureidoglycolate dehydrogenase
MNRPPETFIRVSHRDLQAFVSRAAQTVGVPQEKAELLAEMLTACDLRGNVSHGTRQIARYARWMRDREINPDPNVHVVKETRVSLVVDGDGGLGYFPMVEGTKRAIEKAKAEGIAVVLTRNHGHFGAAGLYSRMPLEHDLLTLVTEGFRPNLAPGMPVYLSAGGCPPISFSAPSGEEPPLVLDFGTTHDFLPESPHRDEIIKMAPGILFRSLGLGAICQAWSALLAATPLSEPPADDPNQLVVPKPKSALLLTFQIGLFTDPVQYRREIDEYIRQVRTLEPLEGFDGACLAGGPEAACERLYREAGVPVEPGHQQALEGLAAELAIDVPWRR